MAIFSGPVLLIRRLTITRNERHLCQRQAWSKQKKSVSPIKSALFYNPNRKPKLEGKTYFGWMEEDGKGKQKGWRSRRFVGTMKAFTFTKQGFVDGTLEKIDWAFLGEKTVVDVSTRLSDDCY